MTHEEALAVQQQIEEYSPPLPDQIWQQWPNESDEHYTWFLVYLSLASSRGIDRAYQIHSLNGQKAEAAVSGESRTLVRPGKASGQWWKTASKYHWEERAARYDVFTLSQLVPQTVQLIFATIAEFAKVTMEQLQSRAILPQDWLTLKSSVETLANYISPEIIQATVTHATDYDGLAWPEEE